MAFARWPSDGVGLARQHRRQRDIVGHVEEGDQVGCLEDEADQVAAQRPQIVNFPAGPVGARIEK